MKNVSMPFCWSKELTKKDSFQEKWPVDQRLRDYLLNCSVEMKLHFVPKIWVSVFFYIGNIHVLRKHKGGREGVSQMLTFAYGGGTVCSNGFYADI